MRRFNSLGGHGYADVECAINNCDGSITAAAVSISNCVDIPVDTMTCTPFDAMCRMRAWSVSDADATLMKGTSNSAIQSAEGSSQHDAVQAMPRSRQYRS